MNGQQEGLAQKLDGISWAVSLIWVGVAFQLDVSWGWGLLGAAAIILGAAVIRWLKKLPVEGFSVAVGVVLLEVGVWELFRVSWPLVPILISGCGLAVLWRTLRGQRTGQL